MSKGLEPLQLIFSMVVLIVVTLILIRLFISRMNPEVIAEPIKDIQDTYNYQSQISLCQQKCSEYTTQNCERRAAVNYCLQKIRIDIDGNKLIDQKGHGNFVANMPYCEDGLYCFHIMDCYCGTYILDAAECLRVLCEYYMVDLGQSAEDAIKLIIEGPQSISPGTCEFDVNKWKTKYVLTPFMKSLRADWWWTQAGYNSPDCENIQTGVGEVTLSNCALNKTTDPWSITCDTNCLYASGIIVLIPIDSDMNQSIGTNPRISDGKVMSQPTLPNTLNGLCQPGTWTVILTCKKPSGNTPSTPLTVDSCERV